MPILRIFSNSWKLFWAFGGPTLSILGAWAYWHPSLSIASGVNLDPSQSFQTQFVVTNTGHSSIYDVTFFCGLRGEVSVMNDLEVSDPETLMPVATLEGGGTVSRGCFTKSKDITGMMLLVQVRYNLPVLGWRRSSIAWFSIRKGTSGNFLVVEPTPDPIPPPVFATASSGWH